MHGGRARPAAAALRAGRARLGRARREPARDRPGQCADLRRRRRRTAPRIAGSRLLGEHVVAHPARSGGALLQGRHHGEEPGLARLGRDLARAHRPLGRRAPIRRTCSMSTSSSTCAACTATSDGGRAVARRLRCGERASGFRQASGRGRRCDAAVARLVRPLQDRAWPHRSEEGGPVRHRQRRAGARHLPSRRRAFDAGAARRLHGARTRRARAISTCSRRRMRSLSI